VKPANVRPVAGRPPSAHSSRSRRRRSRRARVVPNPISVSFGSELAATLTELANWLLLGVGATLLVWAVLVALLVVAGRRGDACALVRVVPDCLMLLGRLVRDPRLNRTDRIAIVAVLAYLALPFDLVPDFIPIAGQLDDTILVALLIRRLRRTITRDVVRQHWPGPTQSLEFLFRFD
jgi:uncharacterized membrane protein YkvA (DUF1232 family)